MAVQRIDATLGIPLSSWVKREQKHEAWVIDGLIRRGDLVEVVEQAKAGKTTFVVQLLSAILKGDKFLDRPTTQDRVAYLGIEDRPADLQQMFVAHGVNTRNVLVQPNCAPMLFPVLVKLTYSDLSERLGAPVAALLQGTTML